eukprot:403362004
MNILLLDLTVNTILKIILTQYRDINFFTIPQHDQIETALNTQIMCELIKNQDIQEVHPFILERRRFYIPMIKEMIGCKVDEIQAKIDNLKTLKEEGFHCQEQDYIKCIMKYAGTISQLRTLEVLMGVPMMFNQQ